MYLISTQGTQYEQNMLKSFFEKISPSLKERVCIEMFYDVMKDNAQIYSAVMRIAKEYRIENPNPPLTQK